LTNFLDAIIFPEVFQYLSRGEDELESFFEELAHAAIHTTKISAGIVFKSFIGTPLCLISDSTIDRRKTQGIAGRLHNPEYQ
jgi:hypothetical protein